MRISMVTETYPPEINGVALTVRSMVESLRNHHKVCVVRPRQKNEPTDSSSAATEYLMPSLPLPRYDGLRFGLPTLRRIARILDESSPDAMYIATEGPLGWSALRSARRRGIPVLTGSPTRLYQYASHSVLCRAVHRLAPSLRRCPTRARRSLSSTIDSLTSLSQPG